MGDNRISIEQIKALQDIVDVLDQIVSIVNDPWGPYHSPRYRERFIKIHGKLEQLRLQLPQTLLERLGKDRGTTEDCT